MIEVQFTVSSYSTSSGYNTSCVWTDTSLFLGFFCISRPPPNALLFCCTSLHNHRTWIKFPQHHQSCQLSTVWNTICTEYKQCICYCNLATHNPIQGPCAHATCRRWPAVFHRTDNSKKKKTKWCCCFLPTLWKNRRPGHHNQPHDRHLKSTPWRLHRPAASWGSKRKRE